MYSSQHHAVQIADRQNIALSRRVVRLYEKVHRISVSLGQYPGRSASASREERHRLYLPDMKHADTFM